MRQVDIQARNVDEAVRLALEQLGRSRDQVKVEVLSTDPGGDEVLVRVTAPDVPGGAASQEEVSPRPRRQETFRDRGAAPERDRIEPGNRADAPSRGERTTDRGNNGPRDNRGQERMSGPGRGGERGNRMDRGGPQGGGMGNRYGRQEQPMPPRPDPNYDPDVPGEIELDSSLQAGALADGDAATPQDAVAPQAAEILQTILLGMKIRGRIVRRTQDEEGEAAFADDKDSVVLNVVDVNERDQMTLVGRRGETLDAIQFLVNLILSRQTDLWARISVDIEGYRLRRKHALINLARRTAEQVQTRKQAIPLEAMSAQERRIVHMTLAEDPNVSTESSGFEPDRRVVVLPK